jgi:hypothetical protein
VGEEGGLFRFVLLRIVLFFKYLRQLCNVQASRCIVSYTVIPVIPRYDSRGARGTRRVRVDDFGIQQGSHLSDHTAPRSNSIRCVRDRMVFQVESTTEGTRTTYLQHLHLLLPLRLLGIRVHDPLLPLLLLQLLQQRLGGVPTTSTSVGSKGGEGGGRGRT